MELTKQKNSAFTLIELLVAMGIFVIVISFSGQIFKVSLDSHRIALANAEIMQKFRAITNQLESDFRGLDKDGEIVVAWQAKPESDNIDGYARFDRIMFFAEGDFQSYGTNLIRGNAARICYSMAKNGTLQPEQLDKSKRILARTQHILTDDEKLPSIFDPNSFTYQQWYVWNNLSQYDKISMGEWKLIPEKNKADILSFILDINVKIVNETGGIIYESKTDKKKRGVSVDTSDPNSIHLLLCEGVGEFKIQGWNSTSQTWMPEEDPDGNGNLSDSHFFLNDPNNIPAVLYSWPFRGVNMNNVTYPTEQITRDNFNSIPGLGRALKFTFTLFDSKGIIKGGRTFTYIVNLDK